ncbi:hypothetical protein NPIL_204111 [Nephila pilipes]|uniref:Uncharacterized protein n=1 Tax=Nephila pilipes TaxID=299642 RepID=A0A8X6TT82_NEPPI|nr:hypothetical protein NPIL_204111 [Nephila pilipes]
MCCEQQSLRSQQTQSGQQMQLQKQTRCDPANDMILTNGPEDDTCTTCSLSTHLIAKQKHNFPTNLINAVLYFYHTLRTFKGDKNMEPEINNFIDQILKKKGIRRREKKRSKL